MNLTKNVFWGAFGSTPLPRLHGGNNLEFAMIPSFKMRRSRQGGRRRARAKGEAKVGAKEKAKVGARRRRERRSNRQSKRKSLAKASKMEQMEKRRLLSQEEVVPGRNRRMTTSLKRRRKPQMLHPSLQRNLLLELRICRMGKLRQAMSPSRGQQRLSEFRKQMHPKRRNPRSMRLAQRHLCLL